MLLGTKWCCLVVKLPNLEVVPHVLFLAGNFVMTVRTGNLLYTSGHLPISLEGEMTTGKVGFL